MLSVVSRFHIKITLVMLCFKCLFLGLFALFLTACGGGSTDSSSSSSSGDVTKILAVGDSIGVGFGGVNAWPDLVRNNTGFPVINYSMEGRHAAFSAQNIINAIDREQPSHLLILLGTNDSNNGSISGAIFAMSLIVEHANANNVVPIVATVPPRNSRSFEISAGYRTLDAIIADVEAAFGSGAGLFQSDEIHPNNAGQDVIAATFISVL